MTGLFFDEALLPQGWARDVRITIADGRVESIVIGSAAEPGDERHRIGLPGICNLHSHAFQRGMAGLAEIKGASSDSFWTWRELMYRFVGRMTADDIEAVAAQAYVEMLEAGFTRVGEFHYIHHDVSGAPYGNLGRVGRADRRGGGGHWHRSDAVAGILRACRIWRSCSRNRTAALCQRYRPVFAVDRRKSARRGGARGSDRRRRAAFAPRGHAGRTWGHGDPCRTGPDSYSYRRANAGSR